MVVKFGRFGAFLACSGYPECKNIKKIQKGTGVVCPKCGEGELVERRSKRGIFYSCSKYPQCKFLSMANRLAKNARKTGDLLIIDPRSGVLKVQQQRMRLRTRNPARTPSLKN
jgi:DNA topoisomerase-1